MRKEMNITSIPTTLRLGESVYIDDEALDLNRFRNAIRVCDEPVGSTSPHPLQYRQAIHDTKSEYIITASSQISDSYANAVAGSIRAANEGNDSVDVFDTKSLSAGESLVAIKLFDLLQEHMPKFRIIETLQHFIDSMKTYFVLSSTDRYQYDKQDDRLYESSFQSSTSQLIVGADGEGGIKLFDKVCGAKRMIQSLLTIIDQSGRAAQTDHLVVSYCGNITLAEWLFTAISQHFSFKNVYLLPMGGLSSLYMGDMGISLAC